MSDDEVGASSPYGVAVLPSAFCSFDVEVDGTNPLQHSMRSIGIALFSETQGMIDSFYVNLFPQKEAVVDEKTMKTFWEKHPEQWKMIHVNQQTPQEAMLNLARWLSRYQQMYTLKWVARPANCDWMWLKCYYEKYGPDVKPDIGYYCHDLSSLLRAYVLCNHIVYKKDFMTKLSGNAPYTHNALDDAVCQGKMYMNLRLLLERA